MSSSTTVPSTRTTRLPAEIVAAAETEGRREHRSAAKQIEHWVRIGMLLEGRSLADPRRLEDAIAGETALSTFSPADQRLANAAIDATIAPAITSTDLGQPLRASGMPTVSIDSEGRMVRRDPDGTVTVL